MVILEILGVLAIVIVLDRLGYYLISRPRFERNRRKAKYPLTDPTNWRQPSNGSPLP